MADARGALEERDAGIFRRRQSTTEAEDLSGMWDAGGNQRYARPRVRREPAVFARCAEQKTVWDLRRARGAGELGAADRKHPDVWSQLDGCRRCGRRRWSGNPLGNGRRNAVPLGGQFWYFHLLRPPVVETGYGHVSARRIDSHRLQHDGPDAVWSGLGRTLWVRAL